MSRLRKLAFVVAIAAAFGFVVGAVTSAMRGWGSPLVSVVVENHTSTAVGLVNLHISSCGATSSLSARNIQPGTSHTFRFLVCGEGGYKLDAMLERNMVLSSGAYVESGYKVIESIGPFQIKSKYKNFPL